MHVKQHLHLACKAILDASIEVYMCVLLSLCTKINFVFNITYDLCFSINLILRTTHNAHIPTVQHTIPVPMRPLTSDCMVLIRYGQYPYMGTVLSPSWYRIEGQ